jgi:hypothetical protein
MVPGSVLRSGRKTAKATGLFRLVLSTETVSNLGGLLAIGPGGRPGGAQAKRDDQGRDDLPALFSPQV